jgi:hypothetical protein
VLQCFSLRLNVLQKRQPPVPPRDPIGIAAIQQIAFTDHSKQLQVRREYGTALMRFSSSRIATSRTLLPAKTETTFFVMISPAVFGGSMTASRLVVSHAVLPARRKRGIFRQKSSLRLAPRCLYGHRR